MTQQAYTCIRCGKCCHANMLSFVKDKDISRWKNEGREDILHIIVSWHPVWGGDHLVLSETGRKIYTCPFLIIGDAICTCSIYGTRPVICKIFNPGLSP